MSAMLVRSTVLLTLACLIVSGCDEQCENGYKIKKEYSTVFWEDSWHENLKDEILDGAVRTSTWAYKSGRSVDIRCFQDRTRKLFQYDLRYSIGAPLLARLVSELQKAGPAELLVNIDGATAATVPVSIIKQESGIDFLGSIEPTLIAKLEGANEVVVVMPRQNNQKLDEVVEFKVAGLRENIQPVKKACAGIHSAPEPTPVNNEQEKKKASN